MLFGILQLLVCSVANDGSGALGVGGTVMPMGSHRYVRLVSEQVFVKLPQRTVETRFIFKNEGPATSVVMIFPENGIVGEGTWKSAKRTYFRYFRSWVDGKAVKVSRLERSLSFDTVFEYEFWWTKRVAFKAGQIRTVVNKYQGGLGVEAGEPPMKAFEYILRTGASWKGTIGSAIIEVDVSGIKKPNTIQSSRDGFTRKGRKLIWTLRDFEPKEDDNIKILWRD